MCERDEQIADLTARLAEAERDRDAALDKALKYDIDACGIELRNQEAVELIELRAEVARLIYDIERCITVAAAEATARVAAEARLRADAITAQCEWEVRSGVTEARLREMEKLYGPL
jgi:replicative superfamily II helicase